MSTATSRAARVLIICTLTTAAGWNYQATVRAQHEIRCAMPTSLETRCAR